MIGVARDGLRDRRGRVVDRTNGVPINFGPGDFPRRPRRAPPPGHRNRRAAIAGSGADSRAAPAGRPRSKTNSGRYPRRDAGGGGLSGSPRPRTPLASRRRPQPATLPRPARRRTSSSPTSGSSTCSPRASRRGSSRPAGAEVVPAGTAGGEALSGVGGHGSRLRGQTVSPPPSVFDAGKGSGAPPAVAAAKADPAGVQADGPRRPGGCVRRPGSVRRRELGRRWSERATACVSSIRTRRGPTTARSVPPPGRNPKHDREGGLPVPPPTSVAAPAAGRGCCGASTATVLTPRPRRAQRPTRPPRTREAGLYWRGLVVKAPKPDGCVRPAPARLLRALIFWCNRR